MCRCRCRKKVILPQFNRKMKNQFRLCAPHLVCVYFFSEGHAVLFNIKGFHIELISTEVEQNSPGVDRNDNSEESSPVSPFSGAFQMELRRIPVEASLFVVLASAVPVNSSVLLAMFKVSSEKLQAKFLLVSNFIASITLSLFSKLPAGVSWICKACGLNNPVVFACFELMTWLLPSLALFNQGFSIIFP